MEREAVSRWELSSHFWAESDPPEPCNVARGFFQKCARQFDRLIADKRVKYRLQSPSSSSSSFATRSSRGRPRGPKDFGGDCHFDNTDDLSTNDANGRKDVIRTPSPLPPLCVIKQTDDRSAAAAAREIEKFGTVPFQEVSIVINMSLLFTFVNLINVRINSSINIENAIHQLILQKQWTIKST